MPGLFSGGSSESKTDPAAAALAQKQFKLAEQELAAQRQFREQYLVPILKILQSAGLNPAEMNAVTKQLFGAELEQITQSFGAERGALTDLLASTGFRSGSQAAGLAQLGIGEANAITGALRNALSQNVNLLLQSGNLATGNIAGFNPQGLFGPALGAFSPVQKSRGPGLLYNLFTQGVQGTGAFLGSS